MTEEKPRTIRFWVGGLDTPLKARSKPGLSIDLVAKRDLGRYYALLEQALSTVTLTEQEWEVLRVACNGIEWPKPREIRYLWVELEDAITLVTDLSPKVTVDREALVATLKAMSYWQSAAIVDALEQYYRIQEAHGVAK